MNKKLFVLIIICIILVIIGFAFSGLTIYRFILIQNLYGKIYENVLKDNYYMKTTSNSDGVIQITEAYYRGGVGKLVANNGIYTWVDGEYAYMIDEEQKEAYVLNIKNENIGLVSYDMFATIVPGYNKSFFKRFLLAGNMKNSIKKSKDDDKKCYIIKIDEGNTTKTVWLNEKGTPYKGEVDFKNGKIYKYEYEIKFNSVTLKNIELPHIDDYDVINAETNEIIKDKINE